MMASKGIWSGIALALVVIINLNGANAITEAEIKKSVEEYNKRYYDIQDELRKAIFITGAKDSTGHILTYVRLYNEMVGTLKSYPVDTIKDELLKRQVTNLLSYGVPLVFPFSKVQELMKIQKELDELATRRDPDLCSYDDPDKCKLAYLPHIRTVITNSKDPLELSYYWVQWRENSADDARDNLRTFIEYFRSASQEYKFNVTSDVWYAMYQETNFIKEMENVITELEPLYKELHAYVYNLLQRKHGELNVPLGGQIPQHLLEQTLAQAWKKESLLEQPYPKKRLPNMANGLDANGYNPEKLVRTAAEFFESMGFEPFNETFYKTYVKPRSAKEVGQDCKPLIFNEAFVAILYCPKPNFRKFLQIHGYMATAEYTSLRNQHPFGLNEEACPGFENAIGEAVILSSINPKHVTNIGLLHDYKYDDEMKLNILFRLGIHTIFNIPTYFVHDKLLVDTLDETYPKTESNCHYWKLMNKYAGVSPPVNRTNTDLDLPYRTYENIAKNHQTKKFISEVVGYQIYRALCKKSGQYVPGDAKLPLQNCDFYGNKDVGAVLKEAMSLGSTKHWRDVLELITGERKLSASGLLEYYEPLREWLQTQNKLNEVTIGWSSDVKCA